MNRSASTRIERLNNRTIFADIVVQKKNVKDGRLLRPIYVTDYSAGVLTEYATGAVETTPAELESYIGPDGPVITVPAAPTDLLGVIADSSVLITFTAGSDGGSPITDYEYSLDGVNFISLGITASPATITGLINGQNYSIVLRAVNAVGPGFSSDPLSVTPAWIPSAPENLVGTPGNGQVSITFDNPDPRGSSITNFKYSLNNGVDYSAFSPAVFGSPVTITDLDNGTTYQISLRAVNSIGDGDQSSVITVTPELPGPPSGNVYTSPTVNTNVTTVSQRPPGFSTGNSYSFNGSNAYLSVPGDNSWAFGTADFTIEWFQYQTDNSSFPRIFGIGSYPSTSIGCSIEGGTFYGWFPGANGFGSAVPYKNTWVHFAIVRFTNNSNETYLRAYKNGVKFGSDIPNSTNITNNSTTLYIGAENGGNASTFFGGYITNMRIVKGLAVYTGNFTVPTSALTITASENPYGGSNTVAIPDGYTKLLFAP